MHSIHHVVRSQCLPSMVDFSTTFVLTLLSHAYLSSVGAAAARRGWEVPSDLVQTHVYIYILGISVWGLGGFKHIFYGHTPFCVQKKEVKVIL